LANLEEEKSSNLMPVSHYISKDFLIDILKKEEKFSSILKEWEKEMHSNSNGNAMDMNSNLVKSTVANGTSTLFVLFSFFDV